MEWDVKFVLAKLLNDMKYKEAVELINAHNDNVDAQDVDIFISGFSLVYSELLNPILPIFVVSDNYIPFLKYIDFNFNRKVVNIFPEKYSNLDIMNYINKNKDESVYLRDIYATATV